MSDKELTKEEIKALFEGKDTSECLDILLNKVNSVCKNLGIETDNA